MTAALIQVQDLYKSYQRDSLEIPVLRDINLEIAEGEFIAFMGPSGSGKTTLLNLIAGIDKPTSGKIIIAGIDVTDLNESELAVWRSRNVGFIFQFYNLIPVLTALENVELPLMYANVSVSDRHARALDKLKQVGLGERADHQPSQLSGGQQQRVAIARALVNNPALILADEPTGALDSRTSVEIMALLQELNAGGMTIVLVTHEHDVAAFASREVHFRDGKVVSDERQAPRSARSVLAELDIGVAA